MGNTKPPEQSSESLVQEATRLKEQQLKKAREIIEPLRKTPKRPRSPSPSDDEGAKNSPRSGSRFEKKIPKKDSNDTAKKQDRDSSSNSGTSTSSSGSSTSTSTNTSSSTSSKSSASSARKSPQRAAPSTSKGQLTLEEKLQK